MPWRVEERDSKWIVVNEITKRIVGRHSSREDAERHLRALYANVPDARNKEAIFRLVDIAAKESIPEKYILAAFHMGVGSTKKSVNEIVRSYRDRLLHGVVDVMNGISEASDLEVLHRSLLRDATAAYVEGMIEGGAEVDTVEISPQDEQEINSWLSSQLSYVRGFAENAAKYPQVPSDGRENFRKGIVERIDQWSQSVYSLGMLGFASIRKDRLGQWLLGSTKEHCFTCRHLDGKVHRLSWYTRRGYIPRMPGSNLECSGFNCLCSIIDPKTGEQLL